MFKYIKILWAFYCKMLNFFFFFLFPLILSVILRMLNFYFLFLLGIISCIYEEEVIKHYFKRTPYQMLTPTWHSPILSTTMVERTHRHFLRTQHWIACPQWISELEVWVISSSFLGWGSDSFLIWAWSPSVKSSFPHCPWLVEFQ